MIFPSRPARTPALSLVLAFGLGAAMAQTEPPTAAERAKKVAAAGEQWLASDQASTELLAATVKVLLVDQEIGIPWVGDHLAAALADRSQLRSKGVIALATHVALEFLRRQHTSGVVYAGQYDALRPLQPFVGDLFFMLLLKTPDWYPDTHRVQLVPALRDLQPIAPDDSRLDPVVAIVENVAIEPEPLRIALACMLWQWGHKQYAQPFLEKLQKDSTEGDVEDRIGTMLELATLQYQLREYRSSAATHQSLQRIAEAAHYPLKPLDYYSAACVLALTGNVERGIEVMTKCADLQVSPNTDTSHKVERKLIEKDPEIAALRRDPRFAAIVARMFPPLTPVPDAHGR